MDTRVVLRRLEPRERRTVAIGLIAVLAAWLGLRAAPHAWASAAALHERAVAATAVLQRARGALRADLVARDSLGARAARLVAWAPRLFGGASTSEAAAELSSFVSGAAAMHRVRIVRQDARPDSIASVFTRLGLRLEAEGDIEGVGGWIASLEESPRLIEVQALNLSAPDPSASAAQPERLHVELVVTAWSAPRHQPRS